MNHDTTIMMITFNRLELTKRMLDNLVKNTTKPYNLVIVDNGSTDETNEYLFEFLNSFKYPSYLSSNADNAGIAIGRNQAMKIANEHFPETKWYCTIDNDVEVPEGWLSEAILIMEKNPSYGMIGVNMEGMEYPIVNLNGTSFQSKQAGNLGTACMVFKKSVHQMLGYFNTEYGLYGEEDADYGMRCRVAGFKLGYIKRMGTHFGVNELDQGEYREWKTAAHSQNLNKFKANCGAYVRREKPIYIDFKE